MYIYNMRLRNINYQTYGGTYAWVKAGLKVIRKLPEKKKQYHAWGYATKEQMEKFGRRYNPCGEM